MKNNFVHARGHLALSLTHRLTHLFVRKIFMIRLTLASLLIIATTVSAQINPLVLPTSGALSKQAMSRLLLTDIVRINKRLVAVGDRGYIVYSDDNAKAWSRANTPANMPLPLLNAIYASDANTLWAVGHDSHILKSIDQGANWLSAYMSSKDMRPLMDIVFIDANTGFAVGAYGAFYETSDAGKIWALRKVIPANVPLARSPSKAAASASDKLGSRANNAVADEVADEERGLDEDKHLNAIIKLSDSRLLIVGEAGMILLSEDNGKTWSRIVSPYQGSFFGAVMADTGAVVIFGLRGNAYFAADNTLSNLSPIATNTKSSLMGATRLPNGHIIITGLSGTVLQSTDNGKTFGSVNSDTIAPLAAVIAGTENALLIVGESGAREVLLTGKPVVRQ